MSDTTYPAHNGLSKRLVDNGDGTHSDLVSTKALGGATATFSNAAGSPFTLTSSWVKVCTTTAATRGLVIAPIASATTFDIERTSVIAGASAPTDTYGIPVFGGEDFAGGIPIGDIYLKSATGQIAIVKTGA